MDIVEQQTESLELLTNALQILLGESCSLFEVVTSISSCSQRAAALWWGDSTCTNTQLASLLPVHFCLVDVISEEVHWSSLAASGD